MNTQSVEIRHVGAEDAEALRAIYNYYIVNTPITFDIEPRQPDEWAERIASYRATGPYQCFAALVDGDPVGFAYSSQLKPKAAYDTSVETTIYLAHGRGGGGIGRRLYARLFDALGGEDVHRAFAAITAPNPPSIRLHEMFGFRRLGTFPEVGRKFDSYHDVEWYWRPVPLSAR